jgi:peptide/nickel transport system substrate-binding protein
MFVEGWEVPEYNPELAKQLLEEAGYNGEPIQMRVLNNYYTNQVSTAQINAESLRQIGLNIDFQMKENWQQINDPSDGKRAIRDWSNSAPFPDPVSSIVNQHCQNGGQQQLGEWSNEEFNENCLILERSMDQAARKAAFVRMLEIIEREDPGYTVLHQNAIFYGKRQDIEWEWSGLQSMDFRSGNFSIRAGQ